MKTALEEEEKITPVHTANESFSDGKSLKVANGQNKGEEKLDLSFYTEAFQFISNRVQPLTGDVRGLTRLKLFLENKALEKYNPESKLDFSVQDSRDYKHLVAENQFFNLFRETVRNADVVADLGGFHGFYSLLAASEGVENVYCFEVSERNREKISDNLKENSYDTIEVVDKAVWSSETEINYQEEQDAGNKVNAGNAVIETVSLDSFFEDRKDPDLLKIDIEGAELHALKGAEDLIERSNPLILLEIHIGEELQHFNHQASEVLDFLDSKGYETRFLDSGREVYAYQ